MLGLRCDPSVECKSLPPGRKLCTDTKVLEPTIVSLKRRQPPAYRKNRYEQRRVAGLCAYSTCPNLPAASHTLCERHLRRMSHRATEMRAARIAKGLCIACGDLPQFWGRRCILCRIVRSGNPLPYGARRALREYRKEERERKKTDALRDLRQIAAKLVENKAINGKSAQAVTLY